MATYERNEEEEESFSYALQLGSSSVLPMCLYATIELGVFEMLAKDGNGAKLSALEIARQLPTSNPDAAMMVDRILGLLASHSVLDCSVVGEGTNIQRLYSLSPVSKHFVTNEDGVSLSPLLTLGLDKVFFESWFQLKDAVLEGGISFNRVHGMNVYEYAGLNPKLNKVFNTAMCNQTIIFMKKILKFYKGFEDLKQLVDVGGGLGVTLNFIISAYPRIKGINFDLPHVIKDAPSFPGVEHVGGDMFEKIPSGEAIFLKWILHNWSDEHCLKLLKNCYKAIPSNGKVIVLDAILPVIPETTSSVKSNFQLDMIMMAQTSGGKERSQQEFLALATAAGFSGIRFECFVCDLWVMEFFK